MSDIIAHGYPGLLSEIGKSVVVSTVVHGQKNASNAAISGDLAGNSLVKGWSPRLILMRDFALLAAGRAIAAICPAASAEYNRGA
ncbi:hypothetical protein [Euryhalocaulis caribicus]|uniref:hypothetical protein n=1 Tax=Euryhalocaulis caribicus TaxID=1161401 RepID=UPI0003A51D0D|nr:hypothetical protein [Euryhalocaulis caribicus]